MLNGINRRHVLAAACLAGAAALPGFAQAQTFPTRPITLVVPFAAGGSTDIVARIVGQKMGEILGQTVVIENRAGAGGSVGGTAVAKSAPDGYTILMGTISTHAINPAVLKNPQTDPVKDFSPIALLADVPSVLVVTNDFPAKSVKEVIEVLKANPEKYSYASSGVATPQHLGGELFKTMTGTKRMRARVMMLGRFTRRFPAPCLFSEPLPPCIGHGAAAPCPRGRSHSYAQGFPGAIAPASNPT